MLTGRYPSRGLYAQEHRTTTGRRTNVNVPQTKLVSTDVEKTLQMAMKTGGYRTIFSGKWHISETQVPFFFPSD
jgi:arylsulfatase A-like enzyme